MRYPRFSVVNTCYVLLIYANGISEVPHSISSGNSYFNHLLIHFSFLFQDKLAKPKIQFLPGNEGVSLDFIYYL